MMIFSNDDIVPVVMFHSVGIENADWVFSYLSVPIETFENQIEALCSAGYRFIFWRDLYDHMKGLKRAPEKSIMLTFDDGYLDNWVYVYPILRRYGAKATIFVNPEFVDPSNEPRLNIDDPKSANAEKTHFQDTGFLNWPEMRLMEESGLVDIQSHALTHTWYFSGPDLIGFYQPDGDKYPWVEWNRQPALKPFYMHNDQETSVPWGTPIYEHQKSLTCRRYFPPEEVSNATAEFVLQNGGELFFEQSRWGKKLRGYHDALFEKYGKNSNYESTEAYETRVYKELIDSKIIIESELGKTVDYICWPGGGYNSTVLKLAKKAGYKAWTLASNDKTSFRNRSGGDPTKIKRIASFHKYKTNDGKVYGRSNPYYFLSAIERHKGSSFHKWIGRVILLLAMAKSKFSRNEV